MTAFNVKDVIDLIEKANREGIKFSYDENELKLKFLKGKVIDQPFWEELRKNKPSIIEYFKQFKREEPVNTGNAEERAAGILYEGDYYYDVTPTQTYWLNEAKDNEFKTHDARHGAVNVVYKVMGDFDLEAFNKAISYVYKRHESLRATFHQISTRYMMKVEDAQANKCHVDFRDLRTSHPDNNVIAVMKYFSDYTFSLKDGPLFMLRVFQTTHHEYVVAFKVHHVIFDSWSTEILLRDLLMAYKIISVGNEPYFNDLTHQFRYFLALTNTYLTQNYQRDKMYWSSLYSRLPANLHMPAAKKKDAHKMTDRICFNKEIIIPNVHVQQLLSLANELSTGLFIVLQASFKAYLFRITGQNDLLIGTYVSGRDFPGTEDQIGSYARTVLLRTVFNEKDSFYNAIQKVKQSNADMATYRAYTLTDLIDDMLEPGQNYDAFWKINIQFADGNGFAADKSDVADLLQGFDIEFTLLPAPSNTLIPIDMQIYFYNFRDRLLMEVQYDSSLYDKESIDYLVDGYISFLGSMISNVHAAFMEQNVYP